jgi:hypothetical protein
MGFGNKRRLLLLCLLLLTGSLSVKLILASTFLLRLNSIEIWFALLAGCEKIKLNKTSTFDEFVALVTNSAEIYFEDQKATMPNPAPHLITWPELSNGTP